MESAPHIDITAKAGVLVEALPYIQRFRGSTFVIKYGGSFMDDPNPQTRISVATDIAFLAAVGIQVVVVHGGGKAITRAMAESGIEPVWRNGLRVTDEATMAIVERTLNDVTNSEICELVSQCGGNPKGMFGNIVFLCEQMKQLDAQGAPIDLGFVGEVTNVKTKLIKKALADGFVPIISPVAVDEEGRPYNTNADVAAAAVAASLRARRLVFLCDVPGLLSDPKDPNSLISSLHVSKVPKLKQTGVIGAGMLPKVDSAVKALNAGVRRVHFIDGRATHSILLEIFTDQGIGTEIVNI